ncbi:MAG: YfcC family protein, partial [Firmicutes bacterium]|nr:YfcC family protein [Bacillota bacterium]
EFYGFIPLIIGLGVAMGYDAMFGFAIIVLGEYIGFMGATLNPYTVAVAQSIAGVPLYSGGAFRVVCLVAFMLVCCIYVLRYGKKVKADPTNSIVYGDANPHAFDREALEEFKFDTRAALIVVDVLVVLVFLALGMTQWGWGYAQLCGLFYIMSIVAALISGWSADEYVDALVTGAKSVFWGAVLTGLAKGIIVVMEAALIKDTLIFGLSNLLRGVPALISAQVMLLVQTLINFPISSGSGQAAATMPIMAPLGDIIGVSRQVSCLAFQFGDGLSNLVWPTGGCVIVCGIGGIPLQKWWKWFLPLAGILYVMQMIFLGVASFIFPA